MYTCIYTGTHIYVCIYVCVKYTSPIPHKYLVNPCNHSRVIFCYSENSKQNKKSPFSISEVSSEWFPNILTIWKALFIQTSFKWAWEIASYSLLDIECNWMFIKALKMYSMFFHKYPPRPWTMESLPINWNSGRSQPCCDQTSNWKLYETCVSPKSS